MPDDVGDYQTHLKEIGKTDINDYVPVGGSYKYVERRQIVISGL